MVVAKGGVRGECVLDLARSCVLLDPERICASAQFPVKRTFVYPTALQTTDPHATTTGPAKQQTAVGVILVLGTVPNQRAISRSVCPRDGGA